MPSEKLGGGTSKKKKKKGFFDRIPGSRLVSQTAKDLKNAAAGTPGGLYALGRDVGKDMEEGNYVSVAGFPVPYGKRTRASNQRFIRDSASTLRHPLRNPGYTLLTALGIAPGVGAVGRVAAQGARGTRAAAGAGRVRGLESSQLGGKSFKQAFKEGAARKPVQKERTISHKPRTVAEAKKMQDAAFDMPQWKKDANMLQLKAGKEATYPVTVTKAASRVSTTRAVQRGTDKLRERSPDRQAKKVGKELARDKEILTRLPADKNALGFNDTVRAMNSNRKARKEAKQRGEELPQGSFNEHPIGMPVGEMNALVRALRLYRIGYIPPNWLGAQATNVIQQGGKYGQRVKEQRRLRSDSPETAQGIDRLQGETMGQAMMDTGTSGPGATLMRGVGTSLGKVTDRAARARAWIHEAAKDGFDVDALPELLEKAQKGDLVAQRAVVQITKRAEPAAIKFTRTGPLKGEKASIPARVDAAMARNIFLYKWITGSGQYSARMLAERPTLTAALAQQGKQAPDITEAMGGAVPEFMERYMPVGERDGMPLVSNLQAASLFDMPGSVANNFIKALGQDWRYAGENLNPVQHFGVTALSGKDLFRGQEFDSAFYNPLEAAKFASEAELRSIPWIKLLPEKYGGRIGTYDQENRLFPMSNWDIFLQNVIGGPYPIRANPKTAKNMARQEDIESGKIKRKKKRKSGGDRF